MILQTGGIVGQQQVALLNSLVRLDVDIIDRCIDRTGVGSDIGTGYGAAGSNIRRNILIDRMCGIHGQTGILDQII